MPLVTYRASHATYSHQRHARSIGLAEISRITIAYIRPVCPYSRSVREMNLKRAWFSIIIISL